MTPIGQNALVIGRSMAGLAAAAALTPHFERVLIVEKDPPSGIPEARRGVGQGHHLHNLLKGGELSIERLLPGTCAELVAAGALQVRSGLGLQIYDHGLWLPVRDLGYFNLAASRPLLEHVVLQRSLRASNLEVRANTSVSDLCFDDAGRVNGVLASTSAAAPEKLAADLVVDCTGLVSRAQSSLQAHGYPAVPEFKVNIGISYTSAIFEAPADWSAQRKHLAVLPAPPKKRGAFVGMIEGGRWQVSLHTRFEKELPSSHEEMLAFAREIETPDTADFLSVAKIQSPVRSYRKPDATWRRFDKLATSAAGFPNGLLVLGDAMTSFNPVFGQGMSVAWLQACALHDLLQARAAEGRDGAGLAKDFFPKAMQISREAWNGSTLIDAAFSEVTGDVRPGSEQGIAYLRALRSLLADDAELHADYIGVGQMTIPGLTLLREDRVPRVIAALANLPAS